MRVADSEENLALCICPNCPTYDACMEEAMQALFCARARTSCEITKAGCLCGECPVATEYRLSGLYYCDTGAAE